MEEDVEIELLLQSNENMLIEAAREIEEGSNVQNNNEIYVEMSESKPSHSTTANSETNQEINYDAEVQELLDDTLVTYLAKRPNKHLLPLSSIFSDEESVSSEDSCDSINNNDYFINEIMADDEPKYRGRLVEQMRKEVVTKSEHSYNRSMNELIVLQRLILERDNLLANLETSLKKELQEIEEKQQQKRDALASLTLPDSNKVREPSFTRCFFKKFGIPYFQDSYGFTPPPNKDHKMKLEAGELILSAIPKVRYWTKIHKEMLIEGIRQTLIDENSEKLVKEIKKLKGMFGTSKIDEGELAEKITKCQDKLRFLRSTSYTELISHEDREREYDWMKYSVTVFNGLHSSEECRRFWHVYLKPSVSKASWEYNEDFKLLEIAQQMQLQDWDAIAKQLGTNRTAYQCLVHYQTRIHTHHGFSSGKWTKEEDTKLISVINASKIGDFIPWTKVASHMGNRTHCQIYNRWSNCLNPKLLKGKFTEEEDLLVVSGIEVFGASIKEISSLMNNRSPAQIRERYERYLLPRTSKIGSWTLEEDVKLMALVQKHGNHNWVLVADEMKTRTRTQTRQRYSLIQRMMKTKPGWSITQANRRHVHIENKALAKTQKSVTKVKQEIDNVESVFKLSKLESDTFRIEKLKELRNKIVSKKLDLKKKKRVFSDSSEVNCLLLEYFKHCNQKPLVRFPKYPNRTDYGMYSNEILLMTKYFGHELKLPEFEDEIWNNASLNYGLKCCLGETIKSRTGNCIQNLSSANSNMNCEVSIDYVPPDRDDTIFMKDWWHTAPFDVTCLNFSEIFKRTVFDYSYGMHHDIWVSKMNRSAVADVSCSSDIPEEYKMQQPFYLPPNHLTTLGLRSILLSRSRLRRDASKTELSKNLRKTSESEEPIKSNNNVNYKLLDQFQETMITLFAWPKVLSVTSIESTPVVCLNPTKRQRNQSKNIANLLKYSIQTENDLETVKSCKNNILEREQTKKRPLVQDRNHKHQLEDIKRKLKIEHILNKRVKSEETELSVPCTQEKKRKKASKRKISDIVDCSGSSIDEPVFLQPTITYKERLHRTSKRANVSIEACEPVAKKVKHKKVKGKFTKG